ncbi:LysR family transcriptional regulator [Flexivirga caeni]|uniref:LysR family transcriptional regulator n=1 Tax=Flexivirga caeni TaxID=2294115 RepID=A0A3M9MIR0_9MICO|nr:LysR family transcriptional regulator [Flexivirga caeni]RNI25421.1 LysR family transcriptional regulator [Flexivirga caeni]
MLRQLQGLRSFVSVARWGSVRDAARRQHYDPSTIRSHVRGLERQLGLRLLRRGSGGVDGGLTADGERLAPKAERAVEAVDEVESQAARLAGVAQGHGGTPPVPAL